MKILFSLLILASHSAFGACAFRKGPDIYSLSGPVTKVLEELGLVHQLKGVSIFYPALKKFTGEIIPGGVYLSPAKLQTMKGSLVFFDQSHELRKHLERAGVRAIEIFGRNKTPRQVVESVIRELTPFVDGCDFGKVQRRLNSLEDAIVMKMNERQKIVFFLGPVGEGKLPELVIANDGLVLWLRKKNLLSTYPSELAYVNWSGAIIEELRGSHFLLGLREGPTPELSGDEKRGTLSYPGALIPGLHQLEAWEWFLTRRKR